MNGEPLTISHREATLTDNGSLLTVYSLTPFTQLDYPGHMACIVWLAGCNMRCAYCYNPEIIYGKGEKPWAEISSFLKKRQGMLDAVVFSGGEATLHPHLKSYCREAKRLGYKVKVDTNGSQPEIIKSLIKQDLVDMISLDFKAPEQCFKAISKSNHYKALIETLKFLISQDKVSFEVRTTVHTDLLDELAINQIISTLKELNYQGTYYLQNFLEVDHTVDKLPSQKRLLDSNKISKDIPVQLRNFPQYIS